ncbi:MAG TPA: carboxypeptidase regulatory-like domain-containing protein, partial [Longimicrobiales bacterium]|nr:carboxypeptidase regulatory-like domain-containing protein [Longimicrobiales bacterium]
MSRNICRALAFVALLASWPISQAFAQGTTTGAITGTVTGPQGAVSGAQVVALHVPSGTQYGALTRADGRYTIPNMRVGGPYRVSVTHIGFSTQPRENITVTLNSASKVDFTLTEAAVAIEGVTATAERGAIISPDRTGASTTITREAIASLPSVSGRIADVARLTPQSSGGLSFAGQDSRMNNITVDGSYFNNSFGLRSVPGETSGVAPISLSAIEQFQINIAPYDVRQGNFVGASVNTVTRSGTNDLRGSAYYALRNNSMVGKQAGANTFNPGTFDFSNIGGWISGPIIKNKLFFFANYEDESLTSPGTTFRANTGSETVGGSITRVKASDLTTLSSFLKTNFAYETGPFQDYNFAVPAKRLLAKLDYNVNDKNKLTLRYNMLNSSTDQLVSNSTSLGSGNRRTSTDALNFANSNYSILENIKSGVAELNTMVSNKMANNFIIGYTKQDESRGYKSEFFPFVDIREAGITYTSFGFEPFTPNNELRYNTFQMQDNFTIFGAKHDLTFGFSGEKYNSENVFFQGAQSVYTYASLADFYTDANAFLNDANCKTNALSTACTTRQSAVTMPLFQVGYNNIPANEKPLQPLGVTFGGVFAQDEYRVSDNLKLTAGIRIEAPFFKNTAYDNPKADAVTFRDEDGNPVQYNTGKLPGAKPLFSPRLGFNFDMNGDRSTQIRGGTGIFTGKPAYVWISNQIGNTGVLTGLRSATNTRAFPFNPNPQAYKPDPSTLTGAGATSYALAVTDPDFKFPQVWRSNIGVDKKLGWGIIGTGEFIYNRDVNGIYYINANLPAAQSAYVGADTRMRWVGTSCTAPSAVPCVTRINNAAGNQVTANIVLKNQNIGRNWNIAFSAVKPMWHGLSLR